MSLEFLENKAQHIQQRRSKRAEEFYQEGLHGLAKLRAGQEISPEGVKKTMSLFMQSISHQRQQTRAYVALGYVYILLDLKKMSLKYLNAALDFDPLCEDALTFKNYLSHYQAPCAAKYANHVDRVYEQIEGILNTQYLLQPLLKVTLNGLELKQLKEHRSALEQEVAQLESQIQALDRDVDTHRLQYLMQGLYTQLYAYEQHIGLSEAVQNTHNLILQLSRQVTRLHEEISQNISTVSPEKQLDFILDRCNAIADEIDAYEQQGTDTTELEGHYNKLILLIESLMEELDEDF